MNSIISKKAKIGKNVSIGNFCVIEDNVVIGDNTKIMHYVELRENTVIGSNCTIDSRVSSSGNAIIKDNVIIRYDTIIARGTYIDENSYICPKVMFNNLDEGKNQIGGARVGKNVFIGTNCVLQHGIKVGDNSVLGALAFINKDVPDGEIWFGNPASFYKKNS